MHHRWTEAEVKYLHDHAASKTYVEIAKDLGFTTVSVRKRALRDGITRPSIERTRLMEPWFPEQTPYQIGYLAGLIDGEGSIMILRAKSTRGRLGMRLQPSVVIAGTDPKLSEYLQTSLSAKVYGRQRAMENSRPTWQTGWYGYRCYPLLKVVEPYLLIKREQAQIVMRFLESRVSHNTYRNTYTDEELALHQQIKQLNRQGLSGWKYEHLLDSSST